MKSAAFTLLIALLVIPQHAHGEVGSMFLNGLSLFASNDIDRTADDLQTGNLNPAYDGDYLLTFGNPNGNHTLFGFGYFWTRRTESNELPFGLSSGEARLQLFGFPISAGFGKRFSLSPGRTAVIGLLGQYYFLQASAKSPDPGDPAWFLLGEDNTGDRNAQGPGLTLFAAYEIPFFFGRIGLGAKGRITSLRVDEISGLAAPDLNLNGATVFLSVALND